MKMRAAVLRQLNAPLVIENVELLEPRDHEVLVRMRATGICSSDLHYLHGSIGRRLPLLLGHEGAGEVAAVGPAVSGLTVGDKVILSFLPSCQHCQECLSGRPVFCQVSDRLRSGTMPDGTHRVFDSAGHPIDTLLYLGAFAEHVVVPDASLVRFETDIAWEHAALLGCAFTTGFAAAESTQVALGDSVAVIGCGGVGLATIEACRMSGATTVIALDPEEGRRAAALAVGATHTVDARADDASDQVRRIVPSGVDWAFEAVGGPASQATIPLAVELVRRGGTATVLGLASSEAASINIPPLALVTSGKTLRGSIFGGANVKSAIPRYLHMLTQGEIDLGRMLGAVHPFGRINEAIRAAEQHANAGRTVVLFDD